MFYGTSSPSDVNKKAILEFETACANIKHQKCKICRRVGLHLGVNKHDICQFCVRKKVGSINTPYNLPIWKDINGIIHYEVPEELKGLRIGEQMMIQKLSLYVPIQYLRFGQLCCTGHVCAFPQDIQSVCNILPRLPDQITRVQVIKKFVIGNTAESATKSFVIRKHVVLNALKWLKVHNPEYYNIEIKETNLEWMDDEFEKELPIEGDSFDKCMFVEHTDNNSSEDNGPTPQQYKDITSNAEDQAYGIIDKNFSNGTSCTDNNLNTLLQDALDKGNTKNTVSFLP